MINPVYLDYNSITDLEPELMHHSTNHIYR
jgi:hypothetical protein